MSSTKIEENHDQRDSEGTISIGESAASDASSVASGGSSRSSGSSRSTLSEQIAQERDEDLERESRRMEERRANSSAEIEMLQRQLQEAYQRRQVEEVQHQTKKDEIWRFADEQMEQADAEADNEGQGLEFTAAGLGFGDATPGDRAREWLRSLRTSISIQN